MPLNNHYEIAIRQTYLQKINRWLLGSTVIMLALLGMLFYGAIPSDLNTTDNDDDAGKTNEVKPIDYYWGLRGDLNANDNYHDSTDPSFLLMFVFGVGMIGGFVSTQQRLPSHSRVELKALAESPYTLLMMPVHGGIFAVVLVLIFVSNLLQGDMFPKYVVMISEANEHKNPTRMIFHWITSTVPASSTDLGKLFFWSFVAGFSERFVPQLVRRQTGADESESFNNPQGDVHLEEIHSIDDNRVEGGQEELPGEENVISEETGQADR